MTAERARVEYVMSKTGMSRRAVQDMAARGEIPGSAKFGKIWTFDTIKLARWIRDKENQCLSRATSTKETAYSTPAYRWQGPNAGIPLRQQIAERRKSA